MVAVMLDHLCSFLHSFLHLFDSMLPPFLSHVHSHSIKTLQFGSYDDIEVSRVVTSLLVRTAG